MTKIRMEVTGEGGLSLLLDGDIELIEELVKAYTFRKIKAAQPVDFAYLFDKEERLRHVRSESVDELHRWADEVREWLRPLGLSNRARRSLIRTIGRHDLPELAVFCRWLTQNEYKLLDIRMVGPGTASEIRNAAQVYLAKAGSL